ncbi:acyltransferase [Microvirga ossetica]|uniref:acyltransferase n=1 Tax=Microvirga ossetica TaxID=1882682 RepID=UPI000C148420|nr:acyltransferase [Microvirga ossetica]
MLDELRKLQKELQAEKMERFKRRVSFGDLITDRSDNAREYGFGRGSTCYDNVLILGDVQVGEDTWIGPNVILDGSGGLVIGSFCSISSGVQIYSHDTVRRSTTLGKEPIDFAATRIGNGVYIGPSCIIAKGVVIGDGATIGAMSFVNRDVAAGSKVWGCPAKVTGSAETG